MTAIPPPPVKHLVQYSGGAGSFATAKWLVDNGIPKEDIVLLFADTLIEDEDLYRFLNETSQWLGIEITRLSDGRDPWELFKDKKFIARNGKGICSQVLKRDLCRKWIKERFKPSECIIYLGMDWMEMHRVKGAQVNWAPYSVRCPLSENARFDKLNFIEWMKSVGIAIPRLYTMGFPHNNCGGFCVKAGQAHFLHLLKVMPERYAHHEAKEQELREHLGKDVSILCDRRGGGKRRPLTLTQLRERQEEISKTEDGQHEWGGCGCFSEV